MKVYFIFEIKKEFISLYKNNQKNLYDILSRLYHLDSNQYKIGINLYNQLTNKIDKNCLEQKLYIKLHQYIPYSKKKNIHYINNLYKNEISRLTIKNSYIKLEQEQANSSFIEILANYNSNYFACDFINKDFFFLNSEI